MNIKTYIKHIIRWALQPVLLAGTLTVWYQFNRVESMQLLALVVVQLVLFIVEKYLPAHPDWKQMPMEKATILGITVFDIVFFGFVTALYSDLLNDFFIRIRESANINFWPAEWPLLSQVFLMFFAAEFVFYWVHRWIHESKILWRVSAHGFHHSFKNLHAVNFLTAHPFEAFFVILPAAFVSLLCGVPPEVIVGAGILGIVNSSIAHANIDTNNKYIGLIITTAAQHRRHHSLNYGESNSNYSCKAIIFDRIFGTYSGADDIEETGITKDEISLVDKLLLPFKPPDDAYSETN